MPCERLQLRSTSHRMYSTPSSEVRFSRLPRRLGQGPIPPPSFSLSSSLLAYGLLRSLAKERATALVPEANRLTCSCQSPPDFLLGLLWLLILSSLFLASGLASSCSPSLFETLGPWPGLDSPWLSTFNLAG
ncbi:unnamed protein product [Lupinus luteus]|uniref:Uncharacterized protein n=1 Tax=Lupinus luteus TaxID=3873 RepID=A0AAV1X1Z0_LUPLU